MKKQKGKTENTRTEECIALRDTKTGKYLLIANHYGYNAPWPSGDGAVDYVVMMISGKEHLQWTDDILKAFYWYTKEQFNKFRDELKENGGSTHDLPWSRNMTYLHRFIKGNLEKKKENQHWQLNPYRSSMHNYKIPLPVEEWEFVMFKRTVIHQENWELGKVLSIKQAYES